MDESPLPDGGTGTVLNPAEHLSQSKLAATFSVSFVRQAGVPILSQRHARTSSKPCVGTVCASKLPGLSSELKKNRWNIKKSRSLTFSIVGMLPPYSTFLHHLPLYPSHSTDFSVSTVSLYN